jgi:hypothetical protein
MDDVIPRTARGGQRAGRALGPDVDVVGGVADHRLLPCRAGGGVDAHQLALRHSEEAERVIVPQIRLEGKGQLADVVDRMDIAGQQAHLVEFLLIEGDVFVGGAHHLQQPRRLDGVQIVAGGTFDFRGIHGHRFQLLAADLPGKGGGTLVRLPVSSAILAQLPRLRKRKPAARPFSA